MRVIRRRLVALAVCGLAVASGCTPQTGGKATPVVGEPIAVVAGTPLTVEQLQKKLDDQSPFVRARYVDNDKKKEFLDGQIRFEVLAAEARARGYEKDPEVEDAIKKIIVQRLTREEFDGRVQLKDVTDAELQAWFESHKADYQKPEMARASIVTIAFGGTNKLTRDQAKAAADDVVKQATAKKEDRPFFKTLVEKHSTDAATRAAGGDIRYLTAADVEGRFGKDASTWLFSSEDVNAVSPAFEQTAADGAGAFVVFKRTGRRPAIVRGFDDVKNQIKNVVYRDKRSTAFGTFVDELKKKHNVQVFEDKLGKLKVDPNLAKLPMDAHDDGHGHGGHGPATDGMPPLPVPNEDAALGGGGGVIDKDGAE